MTARERAWVALGSNLGDREAHLAYARAQLARLPESRVLAASRVEETPAIGPGPQGPYLNQMMLLETDLEPAELLAACRAIEDARGRERRERWGARTLDLDIVRFGDRTVREPGLVVPHPEIARRDFWQRELAELDLLVVDHG